MSADRRCDGCRDTHEDEVLELAGSTARALRADLRSLHPVASRLAGGCVERLADVAACAGSYHDLDDRQHRVSRPGGATKTGVTRVAHEPHRHTRHDFGRWQGPLRLKALGANRTARERVRTRRRRTTHNCTGQATTADDDRTNRNRYARSAATPRERLAAVPISTDRHARRTHSAAAGHATHEPVCGRHPSPDKDLRAGADEPARPGASQRDRRASSAAREADRRPTKIARGATTRAQPSVRVRGSFTQGPSGSPRLARVRRPAPRHRARHDANRGSLIRVAARAQRVGTTIDAATATSHRRARIVDLPRSPAREPDRKAARVMWQGEIGYRPPRTIPLVERIPIALTDTARPQPPAGSGYSSRGSSTATSRREVHAPSTEAPPHSPRRGPFVVRREWCGRPTEPPTMARRAAAGQRAEASVTFKGARGSTPRSVPETKSPCTRAMTRSSNSSRACPSSFGAHDSSSAARRSSQPISGRRRSSMRALRTSRRSMRRWAAFARSAASTGGPSHEVDEPSCPRRSGHASPAGPHVPRGVRARGPRATAANA